MIHSGNIDLSGLTNPQLRFFSHMYGASIGELSVWITDASGSMTQVCLLKLEIKEISGMKN